MCLLSHLANQAQYLSEKAWDPVAGGGVYGVVVGVVRVL